MSDFPLMIYKVGGPHDIHGGKFDYRIVADVTELEPMLAAGWYRTTLEALNVSQAGENDTEQDNGAPTRAELEQKASELGIKFDGRTSDKALNGRIEEALK